MFVRKVCENYLSMMETTSVICCLAICGELPVIMNGKIHVDTTTYKSRVNFTCNDDYRYSITGASSAVCLSNGTRSEDIALCTGVESVL